MITMDYAAIAGMGLAAVVSAVSFGMIANYLFDHGLADRNDPIPNLFNLYRKYKQHTKAKTGQVNPLLWIHAVAAGAFILTGVAYTLARFMFKWTF
jgi:hypothetical protein